MNWSDDDVDAAENARGEAQNREGNWRDGVRAIMTKTAELLAERGGTMTAEQIAGLREWSNKAEGCHPANVRMLLKHSDALSARVAVLEAQRDSYSKAYQEASTELVALRRERDTLRASNERLLAASVAFTRELDARGGPPPGQCANPDPTTGPTYTERGCEDQTCQYPKVKRFDPDYPETP